jgi:YD repeat-containing protein
MALSVALAPRIPHPDLNLSPESRVPGTGHSFFLRVLIALLGVFLSVCLLPLGPISAGNIDYVYDELGRLIAVIDETGETAVYQYDAVGNVLSISRQSSAIVSIITFTPSSGPVGTTVTISGTGFTSTLGQNTVTFNGLAAVLTAASFTQLIAQVPSGATTGPISVTTPTGSATSGTPFTIATSSALTITGFSPNVGTLGTSVTIYGTGFSNTLGQNTVMFNGVAAVLTAASFTELIAQVPSGATTGPIGVTTPTGSATSVIPFTISTLSAPTIAGFSPNVGTSGTPVTITGTNFIPTPAHNTNNVAFNGTYSTLNSATPTSLATSVPVQARSGPISVATPYGNTVSSQDFFVPPSPYTAGDVEVTARMTIDGPSKTVAITTANKIAMIIFDGMAGQRVNLGLTGVTISSTAISLLRPDGTTLKATGIGTSGGSLDPPAALPTTGTYTIVVDPSGTNTGAITLTLSNEVTGTITLDGPSVAVNITRPGQNARYTFNGAQGQQINLGLTGVTITSSTVSLLNPDGSALANLGPGTSGGSLDPPPLAQPGTYTILVDPVDLYTGNMTLTLSTEKTGTLTINGASGPLSLRPGQNGRVTFNGTQGQVLHLVLTGVTIPSSSVSLYKPDGAQLWSTSVTTSGGSFILPTLPDSGTYAIFIDPLGTNAGNITLTLWGDLSETITVDGPPLPLNITGAGQTARVTFSGTAGQRLGLGLSGVTIASSVVSILKPDGTTLLSKTVTTSGGSLDPAALPVTGTYSILVDPASTYTGNITLTLSAEQMGTITIDGPAVPVSLTRPGQNARYPFTGTVGQQLGLDLTAVTIASSSVSILKPDGTTLASKTVTTSGGSLNPPALLVSGTYTIVVDPASANTGSLTLTLWVDITGSITVSGPAVAVSLIHPTQNARFAFTGTAGQQLGLGLTAVTIASSTVSILKPNGATLVSKSVTTSGGSLDLPALPVSGTYTILVDPASTYAGSITLTLSTELIGTLTINSPASTVSLNRVGQNARYTFSGTGGQPVTVHVTNNTIGTVTVTLLNSAGTTLKTATSSLSSFNLATQTLATTGTYTITINPSGINPGTLNVSVTSP